MDLVDPGRRERRIELALPTAVAVPFRLSVTGEKDLGDEDLGHVRVLPQLGASPFWAGTEADPVRQAVSCVGIVWFSGTG